MKDYQKWIKNFMDSWKKLDGEGTCELFANKLNYYENPIDPPLTTKEEVKKLWVVVPQNQKNISYKGKIVFADEKHCFYQFTMQRTMTSNNKIQLIDGVMEIKLNNKNLLTYFKQWRFTKEI